MDNVEPCNFCLWRDPPVESQKPTHKLSSEFPGKPIILSHCYFGRVAGRNEWHVQTCNACKPESSLPTFNDPLCASLPILSLTCLSPSTTALLPENVTTSLESINTGEVTPVGPVRCPGCCRYPKNNDDVNCREWNNSSDWGTDISKVVVASQHNNSHVPGAISTGPARLTPHTDIPREVDTHLPPKVLEKLHSRIREKPFSVLDTCTPNIDPQYVLSKICASGASPDVALPITRYLLWHQGSTKVRIMSLRASILYPPISGERYSVILEWRDANNTDVLALLRMEENDEAASNRLMHHGYGGKTDENGGRTWTQTSVAWTVSNFENLKALFGAARHLLGLLEVPVADGLTLYCETSPRDCSTEAIARCARLLYQHFLKIDEMFTAFYKLLPFLSALSNKHLLRLPDGTQIWVLSAVWCSW